MKRILILTGLLLLAACLPETGTGPTVENDVVTATVAPGVATPTLQPTATATAVAPTAVVITPDFAATTPAPLCTPPACSDNEVFFCSGDCPGGCGITCATITPPGPVNLGSVPTDWEPLRTWLRDNWLAGAPASEVRAALLDAGWLSSDNDWTVADFTGDGQPEWVLLLYPPGTGQQPPSPANLWVVNGNGLVYQFYDEPDLVTGLSLQLQMLATADFTGDGLPELVINEESCGAHTCFTGIQVLTFVAGGFTNIVQPPDNPDFNPVISVSYADIRYEDHTADGVVDLLVHGGAIGSAGAGIVRTYTEVWSWNGTYLARAETVPDPTSYRHHILYEANDAYAAGNLDVARTLYDQAINDTALINPEFLTPAEETYAAIVQFATFRLILLDLQAGDSDSAAARLATLQQTYPDAPITQAAATLVTGWSGTDMLPALCMTITTTLETYDNPTGGLADLGYGNPSLTAVDVCPAGS